MLAMLEQTGAENSDEPSKKILKILDMRSVSIKNEIESGYMDQTSFKYLQKCVNLCNQETKKLWNQETKIPRILETKKPRIQESLKPRNQEIKKP